VAKLNRPGRRAPHTNRRLRVRATAVISYRQTGVTKRHTRRRTLLLQR
jgi:hypothetical protein